MVTLFPHQVRSPRNKADGKSRGFAFVKFASSSALLSALSEPAHILDGRVLECFAAKADHEAHVAVASSFAPEANSAAALFSPMQSPARAEYNCDPEMASFPRFQAPQFDSARFDQSDVASAVSDPEENARTPRASFPKANPSPSSPSQLSQDSYHTARQSSLRSHEDAYNTPPRPQPIQRLSEITNNSDDDAVSSISSTSSGSPKTSLPSRGSSTAPSDSSSVKSGSFRAPSLYHHGNDVHFMSQPYLQQQPVLVMGGPAYGPVGSAPMIGGPMMQQQYPVVMMSGFATQYAMHAQPGPSYPIAYTQPYPAQPYGAPYAAPFAPPYVQQSYATPQFAPPSPQHAPVHSPQDHHRGRKGRHGRNSDPNLASPRTPRPASSGSPSSGTARSSSSRTSSAEQILLPPILLPAQLIPVATAAGTADDHDEAASGVGVLLAAVHLQEDDDSAQ